MEEKPVTVVDCIPGSGKTSWAIQFMDAHPEKRFLYISPFLEELDRIEKESKLPFVQPKHKGVGKLQNLKSLLENCSRIAATHKLFQSLDEECMDLIRNGEIILILDEELEVIEPVTIEKDALKILEEAECITFDEENKIIWNPEKTDYDTAYNSFKEMALNQLLYKVDSSSVVWQYPPKVFSLFEKIYIMTFQFDFSIFKEYFALYKIPYIKKSIIEINGHYEISEYKAIDVRKYKELIKIYDGLTEKIPQTKNALSASWFQRPGNAEYIRQLKKCIANYIRNVMKAKSENVLWTTNKTYGKTKLQGAGYTKAFLPFNARAVNTYADRWCLVYALNVYLHPTILKFFGNNKIVFNQGQYALATLIQWIFRSRVRKGEEDYIFIPSLRMRTLLGEWLNSKNIESAAA